MHLRALLAGGCALAVLATPTAARASEMQSAITKSQAKKLAKAGVLKTGDLPGFKSTKRQVDPAIEDDEAALYECMGAPVPTYVVENPGLSFRKGPREITSRASVVDTVKHAKQDLKAYRSTKSAACYKQALISALEEQGVVIDTVSLKLVKAAVGGASGAFAYKYGVSGTVQGVRVQLRGFDISALLGQTELSVNTMRYDGAMPKLAEAVSLMEIAVARVADV